MNKIQELIKIITEYHLKDCEKIKELKNNINSRYDLALMDLRTIDNYNDSIETLEYIISQLEELQNRIIERNERKLF